MSEVGRERVEIKMLFAVATNDNSSRGLWRVEALPPRMPDHLEAEVRRLQTEAERASLDPLAHILAIAAREANRVAEWERRVRAELHATPGSLRRSAEHAVTVAGQPGGR